MEKNKKISAAIAAVMNYISMEEAVCMETPVEDKKETGPCGSFSLWSLSGRQSQMQMRSMMQMKGFHGSKLK